MVKDSIVLLGELESTLLATQVELLSMMNDGRRLYDRGCGLVDMSLLASVLISEKPDLDPGQAP